MRLTDSQSRSSWVLKRARNRRLIGESRSANRSTAAGMAVARCARSWLATATRWATRSRRARHSRRSAVVAPLSKTQGHEVKDLSRLSTRGVVARVRRVENETSDTPGRSAKDLPESRGLVAVSVCHCQSYPHLLRVRRGPRGRALLPYTASTSG